MVNVEVEDAEEAIRMRKASKRAEDSSPSTANIREPDTSQTNEMEASAEVAASAKAGVLSAVAALRELGADPELVASRTNDVLEANQARLSAFLSLPTQPRLALQFVAVWFSNWESFVDTAVMIEATTCSTMLSRFVRTKPTLVPRSSPRLVR